MFKLSKKVEYALLSLQYLALRDGELATAKEISEQLNISFEFLSKTLQTLMKNGLIRSQQGIKGGYVLARGPEIITISHVVAALDSSPRVVECVNNDDRDDCNRAEDCTIKHPMLVIQKKIEAIFDSTTISELSQPKLLTIDNPSSGN